MQNEVTAGTDGRRTPLGHAAIQRFHGYVVAHQEPVETDLVATVEGGIDRDRREVGDANARPGQDAVENVGVASVPIAVDIDIRGNLCGGGNGVAKVRTSGEKIYMKMGTAGIGIGLGVNTYQVVFLFQDPRTFFNFVEHGWQADATASAVAGQAGAEAKTDFSNGMAIYQITDTGLMAHADIAGTKYWKNKKLNRSR